MRRRLGPVDPAIRAAQFRPMQAGDRKAVGGKQRVGIGQRPAGHQRDGTVELARQLVELLRQGGGHDNAIGRIGEIEQGAVDIEKQRPVGGRGPEQIEQKRGP